MHNWHFSVFLEGPNSSVCGDCFLVKAHNVGWINLTWTEERESPSRAIHQGWVLLVEGIDDAVHGDHLYGVFWGAGLIGKAGHFDVDGVYLVYVLNSSKTVSFVKRKAFHSTDFYHLEDSFDVRKPLEVVQGTIFKQDFNFILSIVGKGCDLENTFLVQSNHEGVEWLVGHGRCNRGFNERWWNCVFHADCHGLPVEDLDHLHDHDG